MPDSYTTLWSRHQIQLFKKHNPLGARLEVLFGGPHSSEPGFRRYGVQAGAWIYPLWVYQGSVHVLGRMRVASIISLEEYFEAYPEVFAGCHQAAYPMATFEDYLALHPEKRYLAPTCTDDVALGKEGTQIRLDVTIPGELLERLRFRSQKRERGLRYVQNGKLRNAVSLQGGIYRLTEISAREMETLVLSTF